MGDLWTTPRAIPDAASAFADCPVDYVKVGIDSGSIGEDMFAALRATAARQPVIAVCFAEAETPPTMLDQLVATGVAGIMLDTAEKSGPGLTELRTTGEITDFVRYVHAQELLCGLAGRLTLADVTSLASTGADYLGFRGALCAERARNATISAAAVAAVRDALRDASLCSTNMTQRLTVGA